MPRRGEHIYKRKDGRWEGRYLKTHENKKAIYGYVYAKTYKEAKQKLNDAISNFQSQKNFTPYKAPTIPSFNFEYVANEWLITVESELKESSIVKYKNILNNYLLPEYQGIPINAITAYSHL